MTCYGGLHIVYQAQDIFSLLVEATYGCTLRCCGVAARSFSASKPDESQVPTSEKAKDSTCNTIAPFWEGLNYRFTHDSFS